MTSDLRGLEPWEVDLGEDVCVVPQIDLKALRRRHASSKSRTRPQSDTWFQLAGRAGQEAYELVAAACVNVGPGARPHPTVTGTLVEFFMPRWEEACVQVVQQLTDAGEDVTVSEPPIPPAPLRFDEMTLPCLVLHHRLDPPAEAVPHSERTGGHWSLAPPVAEHRLRTACSWAIGADTFGGVGDVGMIPATREDAPAKLTALFKDIYNVYLNGYFADGSLAHEVVFRNWGVSVWRASYGQTSQLERVEALCTILVEFGADIDLGAITLSDTRGPGGLSERDRMSVWAALPKLWPSYVPDAHPIQILTDQHLAKAHDLSGWSVETISPGRHLVKAKDLRPWFDIRADQDRVDWSTGAMRDVPAKALRDQARNDFGQMIMPVDILKTH